MIRIRSFLMLLILLVILPLILINILVGYYQNIRERQRLINAQQLETANAVAVGFREFVLRCVGVEKATGEAIKLMNFNEDDVKGLLKQIRRENPEFNFISLSDADGNRLISDPQKIDPIPKTSVKAIKDGSSFVVGDIEPVGRLSSKFHVTTAIKKDKRLMGMVDVTVTNQTVLRLLRIRIGRAGNIGIIDKTGRALILTFKPKLTWKERLRTFIPSIRSALKGRPTTIDSFKDRIGGVYRTGASVPIKGIGWVANVFLPVNEALTPVYDQSRDQAIQSLLISLGLSLILVIALSRFLTEPIVKLVTGTEPLRRGNLEKRLPADFRIVEFNQLAGVLNRTAADLRALFDAEMRIAETLQRSLSPGELPRIPGYEVGTYYHSATERAFIGGDFFDLFPLASGKFGIVIGDVMGEGVDAAVSTATMKFTLRNLAGRYDDTSVVVKNLNGAFIHQSELEQFITLIYGVLDTASGRLKLTNAGHPWPLKYGAGECCEIMSRNLVIGVLEEVSYETSETEIQPDEFILLYTDGLTDVKNEGAFFGIDGLMKSVLRHKLESPPLMARSIFNDCFNFCRGNLRDDVAMLIIKRQ